MPRLFTAVDLPEPMKESLASMSFGIPGAKWIASEQLHLTVRFIGEVDGALFRDPLGRPAKKRTIAGPEKEN
jgi:2'-5' RNA ligase